MESLIASGSAIAVVGMAGRFPGARNVREYWNNIRGGVESIRQLSDAELEARGVPASLRDDPAYVKAAAVLEGMDHFDAGFFGFSPRDAAILDPQHRHFLEVAWEVLEDAGHIPERFAGPIGVFAGSGANSYFWANLMTNPELVRDVGFFLLRHTGNDKDFLTTRVSYELNLTGPSVNVQTACSTSLVAVHMAAQSLLLNECDMALAGGVTIEQPHAVGYLHQKGEILSPDGHCRPFDAKAGGTVFGSAVGLVALRRLEDAIADGDRIHAVLLGSAINNDGSMKVGYLAPSVDGQARAIAEALGVSGVSPDSIGYVEAHGTGTEVGDPIEVAALTQAFRTGTELTGFCELGSVKANIGHADTAAGVAGLIKAILALRERELPPTAHFTAPNPAIDFASTPFTVSSEIRAWESSGPRRAGVSSLGVGGTNAFVVLEEAPEVAETSPACRSLQLLPFSGRSERVREAAGADLAAFLETELGTNPAALADAAWTLSVGRRGFRFRRAVLAAGPEEAVEALVTGDPDRVITGEALDPTPGVSFLFAGGGAQYPGMGAGLYRSEAVFRNVVDECLGWLEPELAEPVRGLLLDAAGSDTLPGSDTLRESDSSQRLDVSAPADARPASERPTIALPALFITQLAQARLWLSWGVRPVSMIGHSMGEYTAACLSGVLEPEDALRLVVVRGRLFEELPEGGMLSVQLAEAELEALLPEGVSIAAVNGPELTVASGPLARLARLEGELARREVEFRRVRISVAAHSAMLEPILERFGKEVRRIPLRAPEVPFASNLSGEWITERDATDPDYWVRHLRSTVRFADGVRRLVEDDRRILLEVGPGRTLATLARLNVNRDEAPEILTSMRHPGDAGQDAGQGAAMGACGDAGDGADRDIQVQLTALVRLWTLGVELDWDGYYAGEERRRSSLPTYPFERERYFIEPGKGLPLQFRSDAEGPPPEASIEGWFWEHAWEAAPVVENDAGTTGLASGPILLVGTGAPMDAAIARALSGMGVEAIPVTDLRSTLAGLREEGRSPGGAAYISLLDRPNHASSEALLAEQERLAFYTPLELLKALGEDDPEEDLPFLFLSTGMHGTGEGDTVEPWKALALGPIRTAPRELPRILTRSIDLDSELGNDPDALARILIAELRQQGPHLTAYRAGQRLGQHFVPLATGVSRPVRIAPKGCYLVTGGLGGLGLAFAKYLVDQGARALVLLSRSGLPPRDRWDRWLRERPASDRVSTAISTVRDLEARGCRVDVSAVDVTNEDALRALILRTSEVSGPFRGVIHAAGTLDDEPILARDPARSARVLAPKVRGTIALSAAFADQPLDFECLCSSRSSISGVPGQVDYTAANAFLDAWASNERSSGRNVVSIEWDAWREVGMAHELATGARATGTPDEVPEYLDHAVFRERIRREGGEDVFLARFSTGFHWMLDEHRLRGGSPLIPGAGYLELIRAAFQLREGPSPVLLRDVLFLEPFLVPEGSVRELAVRLRPDGDGFGVAVLGRVADESAGTPWITHVTGRIQAAEPTLPDDSRRIRKPDPALPPTPMQVNGKGLRRPAGSGLDLGPRWANIRGMRTAKGEAILHLELPEAFREDLDFHLLHPALLDVATAGAQELITGYDPAGEFYIPASFGSLRMLAPLPSTFFSHVRYRDPGIDGMAAFDIRLVDEAGTEIAVIEEFMMLRVVDRDAISGGRGSGEAEVTPPSHRMPPVISRADDAHDEVPSGIAPHDGIRALDHLLRRQDLPPVVAVVPGDLPALLAALDDETPGSPAASASGGEDVSEVVEALLAHPAVADAAAIGHRYGPGDVRVVAFIAYDRNHSGTVSELRRFARERIPARIVPQHFVEVAEIPRDRRGRLDRSRVKDPFAPKDDHVPPGTPTERKIAGIWMRLLGVERVSVHDNFLDIGGHSLVGIRALLQIERETGHRLHPNALTLQTLGQIAAECDRHSKGSEAAPEETHGGFAGRILDAVRQSVTRSDR